MPAGPSSLTNRHGTRATPSQRPYGPGRAQGAAALGVGRTAPRLRRLALAPPSPTAARPSGPTVQSAPAPPSKHRASPPQGMCSARSSHRELSQFLGAAVHTDGLSIEALRVYNPNTTRRSLSTSICNCGPSRPRRRTMTDRSTAANLCVRKTDVTRRPVRVNSGWVLSTV
jgi:hypothetical protein